MMYCGPNALFFVFRWYGEDVTFAETATSLGVTSRGVSLADIQRVAEEQGFSVTCRKVPFRELTSVETPAIIFVNPGHFEVLCSCSGGKFLVIDPPKAARWIEQETLAERFGGFVMTFNKSIPATES